MHPQAIGIGFRQPHYRELLDRTPALGFLEVHSENFFARGGASIRVLEKAREHYPISLHGVGLSLASGDRLAQAHLLKLQELVARVEPVLVSEHVCWGAIDGVHFNDLLPIPYSDEALALVAARVDWVQDTLRREILLENISAYLQYRESTWSETGFLAELARRTGCGILFDVNNLYVNAVNFGFDARCLISELPGSCVRQIHLAGHSRTDDCLIDDHGSRVNAEVWELYQATLSHIGSRPTLIEWDTDIPELDVLLDEAARAHAIQTRSEVSHV